MKITVKSEPYLKVTIFAIQNLFCRFLVKICLNSDAKFPSSTFFPSLTVDFWSKLFYFTPHLNIFLKIFGKNLTKFILTTFYFFVHSSFSSILSRSSQIFTAQVHNELFIAPLLCQFYSPIFGDDKIKDVIVVQETLTQSLLWYD